MPRQRRMARPNMPRMAPTQMKTVPSGRVERFIKGALFTGGGEGAGYVGTELSTVFERVGMSPESVGCLPAEVVLVVLSWGRAEVDVVFCGDVVVVVWPLAVVPAAFVVVVPARGVVDVVGLLACASAAAENRDIAAKVERRSDRFREHREGAMATVLLAVLPTEWWCVCEGAVVRKHGSVGVSTDCSQVTPSAMLSGRSDSGAVDAGCNSNMDPEYSVLGYVNW